ncbi:MAG: toll/interleukin-1 receptor domain-containing protein [Anaerolineae bacterium]|nr:toll/interleukin-1 receptor domain-containing protein [Anaerolineae bacterium]
MSTTKHVFISYSHKDGKIFAERLRNELLNSNLRVWMDTYSIKPSEDWSKAIEKGLSKAICVVAVLTPRASDSDQVRAELLRALNRKIQVMPLMVKTCEPPYFLEIYQHIDFTKRAHYSTNFSKLAQILLDLQNGKDIPDDFKSVQDQQRKKSTKQARLPRRIVGDLIAGKITNFRNRESQLQELSLLLAKETMRLVSVIGPSGRGKTTLVYKLLEDLLQNRWPHLKGEVIVGAQQPRSIDGIVYMSAISKKGISFEQLYSYCIEMVGGEDADALEETLKRSSIQKKIDHLLKVLDKGFYIILLDNLETILEPVNPTDSVKQQNITDPDLVIFFAESLTGLHNVKFIITSQEPPFLDSDGHTQRKEIPLRKGLPPAHGIALLRALDESEDFVLRKATDSQLISIVDMVEGDPRALEIFAGIVNENYLSTLDEITEDFFRHPRTTQKLIEDGYKRLSEDERQVLEALAIFTKPVPIAAIQYLLEPFLDKNAVTRIILRLINIYMVEVVDRKEKLLMLNAADRVFIYSQLPTADEEEAES